MSQRLRRSRTANPELDRRIEELLDAAGATANRDQLYEILAAAVGMAGGDLDRLDLKITSAALRELWRAFKVFAPYKHVPKATMFGSARVLPEDPSYAQARDLAALLAKAGWMVVTGAGAGIMAAGMEGAGRERSIGINIRLPFEQGANQFIAGDPKLVEMKYFFTRKLMLLKESRGFAILPGGFGTLDEALELMTLGQTGKMEPSPVVLLDVPGGSYWRSWKRFILEEVASRGLVHPDDESIYRITDDAREAADEMLAFYRNYHSRRVVRALLVIRLRAEPSSEEVRQLSEEFSDICTEGGIELSGPLPAEKREGDFPELPRIVLRFDHTRYGRLRQLIDRLNRLSSAPPLGSIPPR